MWHKYPVTPESEIYFHVLTKLDKEGLLAGHAVATFIYG